MKTIGYSSMYIKVCLNICRTQSETSTSDLWREFTLILRFLTPRIKKSHSDKPERAQCLLVIFIFLCFWVDVITKIRSIISSKHDFNFSVIYLGNLSTRLKKQDRYLLQIQLPSCKKAIIGKWLSKESHTKNVKNTGNGNWYTIWYYMNHIYMIWCYFLKYFYWRFFLFQWFTYFIFVLLGGLPSFCINVNRIDLR